MPSRQELRLNKRDIQPAFSAVSSLQSKMPSADRFRIWIAAGTKERRKKSLGSCDRLSKTASRGYKLKIRKIRGGQGLSPPHDL